MSFAEDFTKLLHDKDVAATTLKLPYPCDIVDAKKIIQEYIEEEKQIKSMHWAITKVNDEYLLGGIRLIPNETFNSAELGFWIGKSYWRKGYTLESAEKVIEFGFMVLNLNRINAHAMNTNRSSISLLEKLGFAQEGYHPEMVIKWGEYKDVITFGLLKSNYINFIR